MQCMSSHTGLKIKQQIQPIDILVSETQLRLLLHYGRLSKVGKALGASVFSFYILR